MSKKAQMPLLLTLPIDIQPTVNGDGYVITDANDVQHFFYYKNGELDYDGNCMPINFKPLKNLKQ